MTLVRKARRAYFSIEPTLILLFVGALVVWFVVSHVFTWLLRA